MQIAQEQQDTQFATSASRMKRKIHTINVRLPPSVRLRWLFRGVVMPDDGQVNSALMIEELYIVPRSLDQGTGDVITSLDFVIDSPVSQG